MVQGCCSLPSPTPLPPSGPRSPTFYEQDKGELPREVCTAPRSLGPDLGESLETPKVLPSPGLKFSRIPPGAKESVSPVVQMQHKELLPLPLG